MNDTRKNQPENRLICFCYNVDSDTLRKAIRAGHRTIYDIQRETSACSGCGGCEADVLEIIEEELE